MAVEPSDQEQAWVADKREFVADSRDDTADQRDTVADLRDDVADARDAAADQREARFDELTRPIPASAGESPPAVELVPATAARAARMQADDDRADAQREREEEQVSRDEATERRVAAGRETGLALAFASIAEQLYGADSYDEVLTRIAEAAVATVTGSQSASVTLLEEGEYRTAGSTDDAAVAVDREQYDANQGPCLDALTIPLVDAPAFPDERWPLLGARPTHHGVQSSLSYHLNASSAQGADAARGSLNIYALTPAAFDKAAQDVGAILAAHASLAARAVGERTSLEGLGQHLQEALLSRDVIGQAKGILMERLKITPEAAFDILKHSSQQLNRKLREIARTLTETGEAARDLRAR